MRFPVWMIVVLLFAFCLSLAALAFAQYADEEEDYSKADDDDDATDDDATDDDDETDDDDADQGDGSPSGDNLARAHDDSDDIGGCGY